MRLLPLLLLAATSLCAQRTVFLDADTANEVDDLYAIVRAFAEPNWRIPVLASAQWQNSMWATAQTNEDSYRLNQTLAAHLGVQDSTDVVRGGHRRMYDWRHMAIHSHATDKLIRMARAATPEDKLTVVVLGALTNLGSALYLAPDIAGRIEVYWLGSTYDFATDRAGLTDFNALMDPQAAKIVLEHPTLRVHVLPVSEVGAFSVAYADVAAVVEGRGRLGKLLLDRWHNHFDGVTSARVLWDVAIVELLADPSYATEVAAPGYGGANVTAYRNLRGEALFARALARTGEHLQTLSN